MTNICDPNVKLDDLLRLPDEKKIELMKNYAPLRSFFIQNHKTKGHTEHSIKKLRELIGVQKNILSLYDTRYKLLKELKEEVPLLDLFKILIKCELRVQAIKLYREMFKTTLLQAKTAIDALMPRA